MSASIDPAREDYLDLNSEENISDNITDEHIPPIVITKVDSNISKNMENSPLLDKGRPKFAFDKLEVNSQSFNMNLKGTPQAKFVTNEKWRGMTTKQVPQMKNQKWTHLDSTDYKSLNINGKCGIW